MRMIPRELTIQEASAGLQKKVFSSVELTHHCFDILKKKNASLNAFMTVCEESAMGEAQAADDLIAKGRHARLTGIPFSVKDAICTRGIRSTGSAKILDTYVPPFDATVVQKIRSAGAVLVGKTNCDAFGHGASNENSMYGPVRNPYEETKVSGGSSGGSAVSVATGMSLFSIAEDTGGSIRQPASFCGIYGLRPSYGRNSRYGVMPMASSLDTVGPMARSVADIALLMEVMAGHDPKDATTVNDTVPAYVKNLDAPFTPLRVGIPDEYFETEGMDEETRTIVLRAIDDIQSHGHTLTRVSLPYTKYAIPVYYILVPSEDSSNLGRLDGIRYGVQKQGETLFDTYAESRAAGFPEEVKRRIMIGTYALSAGYYDAYYRKAQKVRTLLCQDFDRVFHDVDLLVTPTSPFPAFGVGEKTHDVLAMYLADIFAAPASLAGLPGLSVPVGNTKVGLPVGMQIIGKRLDESTVFHFAHHLSLT